MYLLLHAATWIVNPFFQGSVVAPPPRVPLPRPAVNAPMVAINQNLVAAGRVADGTLNIDFDIVEAAWRPEGPNDPVVRVFAFAERGKTPQVPGPIIRAQAGTRVQLSLRNRTDSSLMMSGFRQSLKRSEDGAV
jgi:FtsP/CotA-like multicopper oxidase with cupredoxin domain